MRPRNLNRVLQRWFRRVSRRNYVKKYPNQKQKEIQVIHLPKTFEQVVKGLVNPSVIKSRKFLARETEIDWANTHPDIKAFAQAFHKECKRRGIPLWIFELYRSPERQEMLLKQGRTKAKGGGSPHQYGCAVDIISADRLWDLNNKEWQLLRTIGFEIARKQNLKMVWGGDWGWDMAHWELENWRDYRKETVHPIEVYPEHLTPEWFRAVKQAWHVRDVKLKAAKKAAKAAKH